MKVRHLLIYVTLCLTTSLFGQELYPNLTKKLKSYKDSTVLIKIDNIYSYEVNKHPKDILLLKLWKFGIYDSLKYKKLRDTLYTELIISVDKIDHPKASKIYSIAGNKEIDDNHFKEGILLLHKGLNYP